MVIKCVISFGINLGNIKGHASKISPKKFFRLLLIPTKMPRWRSRVVYKTLKNLCTYKSIITNIKEQGRKVEIYKEF